jgi:8-oxo-dGTP diphosphatase
MPVRREYPPSPIPSVHAVIVRDDEVLLVRRAHAPSQGRWSVPGGAMRLGETVRQTARREVREECGVDIEVGRVVDVADSLVRDKGRRIRFHYTVIYVLARCVGGSARASSDASEAQWVRCDRLDSFDMHPSAREAIRRARELISVRGDDQQTPHGCS